MQKKEKSEQVFITIDFNIFELKSLILTYIFIK